MIRPMEKEEFDAVYAIMERSFPTEEYRRREEQKALLKNDRYTVWCLEKDGMPAGFMAVWDLDGFWFVEHLAVVPELRGHGMGGQLLDSVVERSTGRLCLEVEPPETPLAERRIAFYGRHGFCVNSYPYLQPSISRGKPDVPLQIMSYPTPLTEEEFLQAKDELYRIVYQKT